MLTYQLGTNLTLKLDSTGAVLTSTAGAVGLMHDQWQLLAMIFEEVVPCRACDQGYVEEFRDRGTWCGHHEGWQRVVERCNSCEGLACKLSERGERFMAELQATFGREERRLAAIKAHYMASRATPVGGEAGSAPAVADRPVDASLMGDGAVEAGHLNQA